MLSFVFEIAFAFVVLTVFIGAVILAFDYGPTIYSVLCSGFLILGLYSYRYKIAALEMGDTDTFFFLLCFSILVVSNFSGATIHRISTGVKVKDPFTREEVNQTSYSPLEINEMLNSEENCELSQLMKYAMIRHTLKKKLHSRKKKDVALHDSYEKEIRTLDRHLINATNYFANDLSKRIEH